MITYAWSELTVDRDRPVRGFVIGAGSTVSDLPTQIVAKRVVDVAIPGGGADMLAGTGSLALDRSTNTTYRLESDGAWH